MKSKYDKKTIDKVQSMIKDMIKEILEEDNPDVNSWLTDLNIEIENLKKL